jgi:hypothetical protein
VCAFPAGGPGTALRRIRSVGHENHRCADFAVRRLRADFVQRAEKAERFLDCEHELLLKKSGSRWASLGMQTVTVGALLKEKRALLEPLAGFV